MNGLEYTRLAQQFALFPLDNTGWDYILSALPEEFGELCGAILEDASNTEAILSECGDFTWDLALACVLMETDLDKALDYTDTLTPWAQISGAELVLSLAELLGAMEGIFAKSARKGNGRNLSRTKEMEVITLLGTMHKVVVKLVENTYNSSMEAVFAQNLNKLEERKRANVIEGSGESVEARRG